MFLSAIVLLHQLSISFDVHLQLFEINASCRRFVERVYHHRFLNGRVVEQLLMDNALRIMEKVIANFVKLNIKRPTRFICKEQPSIRDVR